LIIRTAVYHNCSSVAVEQGSLSGRQCDAIRGEAQMPGAVGTYLQIWRVACVRPCGIIQSVLLAERIVV
jgi:hypothetical protein